MTIGAWHNALHSSSHQKVIKGSFIPNGSSAVATTYGAGFTVARTATGTFVVTLAEAFADFVSIKLQTQSATATLTPSLLQVGDISIANKTFAIKNFSHSGQQAVGPVRMTDVSAASTVYSVAPVAGTISKIYSSLGGAITVADSALTSQINGVGITNGDWTVAYTGSAAGDVDSATPTAANTVAAGDKVAFISDGGSSTTATLDIYYVIDQFTLADISTSGTANKINFEVTVAAVDVPGAGV